MPNGLFRILPEVIASVEARDRFKTGDLLREWAHQYPQLFDSHEVRTALNQLGGHFFEWFGAVHLYETTGWLSLIESYQFKVQKWKRGVLRRLGADELIIFFDTQHKRFGRRQAPDLLVYAPDFSDYYFCEVKGPRDHLRDVQIEYFTAMSEAAGGKEVLILPVSLR